MTDETRRIIEEKIPKMEGWCSTEKAFAMVDLILETKSRIVVELGVFGGRSLLPMAMAMRELGEGLVYGIDPWQVEPAIEGESEANCQWWLKDCPLHVIHEGCMKALWEQKVEPWVVIMRCRAEQVAHLLDDGIDILHFDQNHSELASMRDIQIYYPLVKPGGYIWFDDIHWETTKKAQAWLTEQGSETIKELAHLDSGPTCRLYHKPELVALPAQAINNETFDKRLKKYRHLRQERKEAIPA